MGRIAPTMSLWPPFLALAILLKLTELASQSKGLLGSIGGEGKEADSASGTPEQSTLLVPISY
jgi:hypothetical protein